MCDYEELGELRGNIEELEARIFEIEQQLKARTLIVFDNVYRIEWVDADTIRITQDCHPKEVTKVT